MPREDPQDLLSRHDATEGKKVMVQCFVTEEKKEMRLLTLYYSQFTEETSQEQGKRKGFQDSSVPGQTLCLPPRKSEDQPELFSDFLVSMTEMVLFARCATFQL